MRGTSSLYLVFFLMMTILLFSQNNDFDTTDLDIVMLLDNSGSMRTNDPDFNLIPIAKKFIQQLPKTASLSLMIFDQNVHVLTSLKDSNRKKAVESLSSLNYKGKLTSIADAVERGLYELNHSSRSKTLKVILFLTDGYLDTGDRNKDQEKREWLIENLLPSASRKNIRIFAIALSDQADFQLLQQMASITRGEYYRGITIDDISQIFTQIMESFKDTPAHVQTGSREQKPVPADTPDASGNEGGSTYLILGVAIAAVFVMVFFALSRNRKKVAPSYETPPDSSPYKQALTNSIPKVKMTLRSATVDLKSLGLVDGYEGYSLPSVIKIDQQKTLFGRSEHCDHTIPIKRFSGKHFSIIYEQERFYITDMGSTNGTFLNDQTITNPKNSDPSKRKRYPLKDGDLISFHFVVESKPVKIVYRFTDPRNPSRDNYNQDADHDVTLLNDEQTTIDDSVQEEKDSLAPPKPEQQKHTGPPKCHKHNHLEAIGSCLVCGKYVCKSCGVEIAGVVYCHDHKPKQEEQPEANQVPKSAPMDSIDSDKTIDMSTYCKNHPERKSGFVCQKCGDSLCEECLDTEYRDNKGDRMYCRECAAKEK